MYTCVYMYMYVYMYMHIYIYIYVYMYVYMYMYMYGSMYTCRYVYTYIPLGDLMQANWFSKYVVLDEDVKYFLDQGEDEVSARKKVHLTYECEGICVNKSRCIYIYIYRERERDMQTYLHTGRVLLPHGRPPRVGGGGHLVGFGVPAYPRSLP